MTRSLIKNKEDAIRVPGLVDEVTRLAKEGGSWSKATVEGYVRQRGYDLTTNGNQYLYRLFNNVQASMVNRSASASSDGNVNDDSDPATNTVTENVNKAVTNAVTETVPENRPQNVNKTVTKTVTETVTENVNETITETVTKTVTRTVTGTVTETVTEIVTKTVTRTVADTVAETPRLETTGTKVSNPSPNTRKASLDSEKVKMAVKMEADD